MHDVEFRTQMTASRKYQKGSVRYALCTLQQSSSQHNADCVALLGRLGSGSWVIGGLLLWSTIFLQLLCDILTAKEQEIKNNLMIFGKFCINEEQLDRSREVVLPET